MRKSLYYSFNEIVGSHNVVGKQNVGSHNVVGNVETAKEFKAKFEEAQKEVAKLEEKK